MPRHFLLLPVVVLLLGACHGGPGPSTSRVDGPAPAASPVDGAVLRQLSTVDGSVAWLQVLDVTKVRIDQVTGQRDAAAGAPPSAYLPGVASPAFGRITPAVMQRSCRDRYGARTVSAVNFAFFEDYRPSTALSFPVKSGGTVLTGGSSGYGPVAGPRAAYYRTVTLRALSWDATGVTIGPYDPATGAPLSGSVPDALVTYLWSDHPSAVLDRDPPNRYQLAGVVDRTHLAILTVTHATLADAAQLLARQGVHGDIVTFDGGVSTYLWTATRGDLVKITNSDGALPHYLCVHGVPSGQGVATPDPAAA